MVDAASTDGTPEWLRAEGIEHISEPDHGMYDALNKGLDRLFPEHRTLNTEHYFAWLNADEQYLPEALQRVANSFLQHRDTNILCGGALIVSEKGDLLTYRKALPLRHFYHHAGLYNFSCAMFFRGQKILERNARFDASLCAVADWMFVQRLLQEGCRGGCLDHYLASYTFSEKNISNRPEAKKEYKKMLHGKHGGGLMRAWLAKWLRSCERVLRGTRREKFPLTYAIYQDHDAPRVEFTSSYVSYKWPACSTGTQCK